MLLGQKIEELKLSSFFLNEIFLYCSFLAPLNIYSQEVDASDILFLKIQELEGELASLRSELESQAYLIEKLINEEGKQEENNILPDTDSNSEANHSDLKELMIAEALMRFMTKQFLN